MLIPIYRGGNNFPGNGAQDHLSVEPELKLKSADWKIVITHCTLNPFVDGEWGQHSSEAPQVLHTCPLCLHQSPGLSADASKRLHSHGQQGWRWSGRCLRGTARVGPGWFLKSCDVPVATYASTWIDSKITDFIKHILHSRNHATCYTYISLAQEH